MNLEGIMERHHADNLRPTDSSGKVHKDAMNSASKRACKLIKIGKLGACVRRF